MTSGRDEENRELPKELPSGGHAGISDKISEKASEESLDECKKIIDDAIDKITALLDEKSAKTIDDLKHLMLKLIDIIDVEADKLPPEMKPELIDWRDAIDEVMAGLDELDSEFAEMIEVAEQGGNDSLANILRVSIEETIAEVMSDLRDLFNANLLLQDEDDKNADVVLEGVFEDIEIGDAEARAIEEAINSVSLLRRQDGRAPNTAPNSMPKRPNARLELTSGTTGTKFGRPELMVSVQTMQIDGATIIVIDDITSLMDEKTGAAQVDPDSYFTVRRTNHKGVEVEQKLPKIMRPASQPRACAEEFFSMGSGMFGL